MKRAAPILLLLLPSLLAPAAAPDPRTVPLGTQLTSSKGFPFTLLYRSKAGREIWRDDTAKIAWSDELSARVPRRDAAALCARDNEGENRAAGHALHGLPSLENLVAAEKHGFREILPRMRDGYFWAEAGVPGAPNVGYVFSGNLGRPILILYRSINFEHVRCVEAGAKP